MGDSVLLAYFRKSSWQAETRQVKRADGTEHALMPKLRELHDFQRVKDVGNGASVTVTFDVTPSHFAEADESSGDWVISPDALTLVFEDGAGASMEMDAVIKGDQVVLERFPTIAPAPAPGPGPSYNSLASGDRLQAGDHLISNNGNVRLEMQSDGDLVLYEDVIQIIGVKTVKHWSSDTGSHPGAYVTFQTTDGNLVVRDTDHHSLWSTGSAKGAAKLMIQDDCDLVKVDSRGNVIWNLGSRCESLTFV